MGGGVRLYWQIFLLGILGAADTYGENCQNATEIPTGPEQTSSNFIVIPGQPLGAAFDFLTQRYGYRLVTDPLLIEGLTVAPQQGCGSLTFWANKLLSATDLSYAIVDDTLVVYRAQRQALQEPAEQGDVVPYSEIIVVGSSEATQGPAGFEFAGKADAIIDYQQINRMGVTDLASALEMVSGVKLEDNRYTVIRGMRSRYQSVRINGGIVPSFDPIHQSVPMDIFPASILNQVDLRKSVYADAPGSASAGIVNIETRTIPRENFFSVLLGGSYQQGTQGAAIIQGYGGDTDWLGFDDDSREIPPILATAARTGGIEALDPGQRELAGESIQRHYGVYRGEAGENVAFNVSGAHYWEGGPKGREKSWGVTASLGYGNHWRNLEKYLQRFGRSADPDEGIFSSQIGDAQRVDNIIDLNALLAVGFDYSPDQHLGANLLRLRQSDNYTERVSTYELDYRGDPTGDRNRYLANWTEQELSLQQLFGSHTLSALGGLHFTWQVSAARSNYYQPYGLSYHYNRRFDDESYSMGFGFSALEISWEEMLEETLNGSGYFTYDFDLQDVSGELKFGFEQLSAQRHGFKLAYTFRPYGNIELDDRLVELTNPGDILTGATIIGKLGERGFLLYENVYSPNSVYELAGRFYAVDHAYRALYWLTKLTLFERVELIQGLRSEFNQMDAGMWEYLPQSKNRIQNDRRQLLSFSIAYSPTETQNWRIGYRQTLVWPSINELLPRPFEDLNMRVTVTGNPALDIADIDNWDLQWEFKDEEKGLELTGLLFYKAIEQAIEGVFDPDSRVYNGYTFANVESANVYGYELGVEYRLDAWMPRGIEIKSNFARIFSTANVSDREELQEQRPLQGQPEYVANLQLQYTLPDSAQTLSLFLKRTGRELYIASNTEGLPGVIQQPYNNLRFAYTKRFFNDLSFTFSADNLLNDERHYDQGGSPYLIYRQGREYELRLSLEW